MDRSHPLKFSYFLFVKIKQLQTQIAGFISKPVYTNKEQNASILTKV